MTSCEYYHKEKEKCFADEIEVNDLAECLTYVTKNTCNHVLGTNPFYDRYNNISADTLIYQSEIDDEYSRYTLDDITERFEYCPNCGRKNWY
jgi:hypothetical protein